MAQAASRVDVTTSGEGSVTRARVEGHFDIDAVTRDALVAHARSDHPYEVCGLLAAQDGVLRRHWEVTNADRSMTSYVMESRELLRAMREIDDRGWTLAAIYHSHTHTEAFPSPTDLELAVYPDAVYLIVSLQDIESPVLRAFDIRDGAVTERRVRVDGD